MLQPARYLCRLLFLFVSLPGFSQSARDTGPIPEVVIAQTRASLYVIRNSNLPATDLRNAVYQKIRSSIMQFPKVEMNFTLIAEALELTAAQADTLMGMADSSLLRAPYRSSALLTRRRLSVAENGKAFPDLVLTDTAGHAIKVSSFKGKMLFIDFWSSGCAPCRAQMPELKKLYGSYHKKGFEIIGISLDRDKTPWLAAVFKDKQTWPQYAELVSWDKNKTAAQFFVYGIPSNFLVDGDGIIIGQDLSPDQVKNFLQKKYD